MGRDVPAGDGHTIARGLERRHPRSPVWRFCVKGAPVEPGVVLLTETWPVSGVSAYMAGLGASLRRWRRVALSDVFSQKPMDRDEIMFGGALGLGFAVWFFGCMLTRMLFPRPAIKCPQCGNDWTSSDEYPINMVTWKCCPGCGLKINDDVAWREKP